MSSPYRTCSACPKSTQNSDLCTACQAAKDDSESPWDLGPGEWVLRGYRRVWVAKGDDPKPVRRGRCPVCLKSFVPKSRQIYCRKSCKDAAAWRRGSERRERQRAAMNPNLVALMDAVDSTEKETAA